MTLANPHQDKYGQGQCDECDADTFSNEGQANCTDCHAGADCKRQTFRGAREGWWSPIQPLQPDDGGKLPELKFQECKPLNGLPTSRCLGGINSKCLEGTGGPLCGLDQQRIRLRIVRSASESADGGSTVCSLGPGRR